MYSFFLCLLYFFVFIKIVSILMRGKCKSHTCLVGKTVLITGANRGLGYETALGLAARGCRLIIADKDDCEETKNSIIRETNNTNIVKKRFDLASFDSIRRLVEDIRKTEERLDVLINNAAVGYGGNGYTEDNNSKTTQINHLGPLLLTYLLIDLMKKTGGRIIFVASLLSYVNNLTMDNLKEVHPQKYAYGNTKLCNIITAKMLGRKLRSFGVTVNSLHPGFCNTTIFDFTNTSIVSRTLQVIFIASVVRLYGRPPEDGVQTTLHLALSKDVKNVKGQFFSECRQHRPPPKVQDEEFCAKIFEESLQLAGLSSRERIIEGKQ